MFTENIKGSIRSRVAFLLVVLIAIVISTICVGKAVHLVYKPFAGFFINQRLFVNNIGQYDWPGIQAGLKYPDRLLKANNKVLSSIEDFDNIVNNTIVGKPITYNIQREDQVIEMTIQTMRFTWKDLLISYGPAFFSGIIFMLIGVVVYIMKPDTATSWVFLIACFSLSISMVTSFGVQFLNIARISIFIQALIPAAGIHFAMVFPEKSKIVEKRPGVQTIPYIISLLLCIPLLFTYPKSSLLFLFSGIRIYEVMAAVIFIGSVLHVYIKKTSVIARQRAKIVLFGACFAFPIPVFGLLLGNFGITFIGMAVQSNLTDLPLIFFPASIAYAIAKHNLFDVDVYIKRAVGYVIMTALVGFTYFAIQVGVKTALQPFFGEYSEKVYPVIFALLIVFLFHPINRRVQKTVDKLFYRKKFDYKTTITKVSHALTSMLDLNEVVKKIIDTVRKEMFIDRAGVVLFEPAKKECQTLFIADEAQEMRVNGDECIKYDDPLVELLSRDKKMITVYDIEEDPYYSDVKETCRDRFSRMGVSMVLPIIYQDEVKGALALGYKKSGHFYTREDIDLMNTLANHGAVAIENAKLVDRIKKEEIVRTNLSRYLSPQIVDHIIKKDVEVNLGGNRKVVTVMFLDIVGFTALSERLQPEEVVSILNEYFKEMSNAIFRWEGTLDKFIGDEIMAFWGAPIGQPDHAELAVRCALNISKALDELREKWKREGRPVIDCGIGLNTGEVLVGNIGVEGKKMDYTIIGDTVNLASRIEKLTRHYKTRMLITENTFEHIKESIDLNKFGHVQITDLAEVKVRGKEKGVKIYKLELVDEMLK